MTHVLIEGGAKVLGAAFDGGHVDECHIYLAPCILGGQNALSPLGGAGVEWMNEARSLAASEVTAFGDNIYIHGDWPAITSTPSQAPHDRSI